MIVPVFCDTASGANGGTTANRDTTGIKSIVIAVLGGGSAQPTLTDSLGNVYVGHRADGAGSMTGRFYDCLAPIVGPGHNFTFALGSCFGSIYVLGFAESLVFDLEGAFTGSNISDSLTPSGNDALVVSYNIDFGSSPTSVSGGSLSTTSPAGAIVARSGGATFGGGMASVVQSGAPSAVQATWNPSGSVQIAGIISYLEVSAGITVDVPMGTLTLLGFAPIPLVGNSVAIPKGTMNLQGFAPSVNVSKRPPGRINTRQLRVVTLANPDRMQKGKRNRYVNR